MQSGGKPRCQFKRDEPVARKFIDGGREMVWKTVIIHKDLSPSGCWSQQLSRLCAATVQMRTAGTMCQSTLTRPLKI